MGIIFNAVGAVVCALSIAFPAGWKLTLIVLLYVPLMVFAGVLQGKRLNNVKKGGRKKSTGLSWAEKGGMVDNNLSVVYFLLFVNILIFKYATEAIDSVRTVVGLHQEQYFISQYEDCFNKEFRYLEALKISIHYL